MIGKRDKALRYAQERDRFRFDSFAVTMSGDNNPHHIKYDDGKWACDCSFFATRGFCSHTMALEILLENMLQQPAEV
ncbi:MAG TPA: SWIM zinc finger family protein [Bellilinea sp.]|nr:SWIM zinc finger family protein [Bellilinea sp.]